MNQFSFLPIRVICPCRPYRTEKIIMVFLSFDNGQKIPSPCGGCDSFHNSKTCEKCTAILTHYFKVHPDFYPTKPIDPFLPEFDLLNISSQK